MDQHFKNVPDRTNNAFWLQKEFLFENFIIIICTSAHVGMTIRKDIYVTVTDSLIESHLMPQEIESNSVTATQTLPERDI